MSFASAYCASPNWQHAVNECVSQLQPEAQDKTLGFIYASDSFAHLLQSITNQLSTQLGIADWAGTIGLGICADRKESYEQPALSILLTDIDPACYRIFSGLDDELSSLEKHSNWYRHNLATVGVIHGDPYNQSIPQLIHALASRVPEGFMVGGLTSSNQDNPQIAGNEMSEGSLSGVLFSEHVPLATALTQGCTPVGPKRTITEHQRNIIISLDNRPALEVMKEDIKESLSQESGDIDQPVFVGFPVSGSDTGDYLVRNLMGIDEANQLIAVSEMLRDNQTVMFCERNRRSAQEDMQRMLGNIRKRIQDKQPEGALYYSCLGRGRALFGTESEELGLIQDELGNIPLTGFFCNGEIAHNQLYGFTGVLTVFL